MGKVLDSIVREWKEKGLEDNPFYDLLVQAANDYADDEKFDSFVERVITEIPLCTCEPDDRFGLGPLPDDTRLIGLNYRGSHPLLHDEQCHLRTRSPLIIDDTMS